MIDRNVITFVGDDGKQEFLEAVGNEAAYDRSCARADGRREAGQQDQRAITRRRPPAARRSGGFFGSCLVSPLQVWYDGFAGP